uniref:Ammonium transporter AmtB-like domain-containing protein n=1 Tax=Haptolina brevifila TaxID=156173 RepID=A0A7S2G2J5_9EUKA
MVEVGSVNSKNINNIILKGTLDILICAISFWAMGFAIAFGPGGRFIGGGEYWFGSCLDGFKEGGAEPAASDACDGTMRYDEWFFQFNFASAAATIVSGAVAERATTTCYLIYSCMLTAFVYPVIVHWQWGGGWSYQDGAKDYAGSGVVHMTGGLAAIIGAAIIGPRRGRFEGGMCCSVKTSEMPTTSIVFSTIGTMLLWWGWYGFNTGSTLGITWVTEGSGAGPSEAGLVLMNTTLSPAAAGLTTLLISAIRFKIKENHFILSLPPVLNGILAGLVSITAGCGDVRPWAAVVIGIIGGFIYEGSSKLQVMLKIDDVVNAGPVHFWCGMWGVIAIGLFADTRGTGLAAAGGFYGDGGALLAANLKLIMAIIGWVTATMVPTFGIMRVLKLARVSSAIEDAGMDVSKHGVASAQVFPTHDGKSSMSSSIA